MANCTPSNFVVRPPFNADSPGDCFLECPDGTLFKVYRAILCAASTIFSDLFSMPSNPSDRTRNEGEVPIIPVEEDAETLQAMLQMLYPIDPPTIESPVLANKLVKVFDKYFISMTKLQHHLRGTLTLDRLLETDPLTCFTLSWKLGLSEEAVRASRYTHNLNLSDVALAEAIISLSGDVAALVALWDLRYRREESLEYFRNLVKLDTNTGFAGFECHKQPPVEYLSDSRRRARLKEILNVPYPTCEDPEYFLGFQIRRTQRECRYCCERVNKVLSLTRLAVREALQSYPQTISNGLSAEGARTTH